MAPEVYSCCSDELNVIAADVFSLGMVMIVLTCKTKLWSIPHSTDVVFQVVYSPAHGLETLMAHWNKPISQRHVSLFSKMCCLDPESRIPLSEVIMQLS